MKKEARPRLSPFDKLRVRSENNPHAELVEA